MTNSYVTKVRAKRGDKGISLQTLIGVMDIVRAAGISAVGIATKADAVG